MSPMRGTPASLRCTWSIRASIIWISVSRHSAAAICCTFPAAFDAVSLRTLEAAYPAEKRIAVTEQEATHFACNVINVGSHILMGAVGSSLPARLEAAGFHVTQLELSEFLRGGGSAKSLALRLSDMKVTHSVAAGKSRR